MNEKKILYFVESKSNNNLVNDISNGINEKVICDFVLKSTIIETVSAI